MPALPGMVYDPTRNRYFKCPAPGEALPPQLPPTNPPSPQRRRRKPAERATPWLAGVLLSDETGTRVTSHAYRIAIAMSARKPVETTAEDFEAFPTRSGEPSCVQKLRRQVWPATRQFRRELPTIYDSECFAYDPVDGAFAIVCRTATMSCFGGVFKIQLPIYHRAITAMAVCQHGNLSLASFDEETSRPRLRFQSWVPWEGSLNHFDAKQPRYPRSKHGSTPLQATAMHWHCGNACNGNCLLTAGNRAGHFVMWDPRTSTRLVKMIAVRGGVISPSICHIQCDGEHGVYISSMGNGPENLAMWDLRYAGRDPCVTFHGHVNNHKVLSFDVHAGVLVSGGSDAAVRIWDCASGGTPVATLDGGDIVNEVRIGGFDPAGCWVGGLCLSTVASRTYVGGIIGRSSTR